MVWISTNIEYAFGFWKSCCKAQDSLISNALTTRKGSLNMSDLSSAVSPFHFTIFCLQPSSMSCVGYLEHTMHILYERKFHRVAMVIYARVFVTMCMWVCVYVCAFEFTVCLLFSYSKVWCQTIIFRSSKPYHSHYERCP